MEQIIFKTKGKALRESRDEKIFSEYQELVSLEGQSRTGVVHYLMKKYGICSAGTIYLILNRVRDRKAKEEEQKQKKAEEGEI